MGGKIWLLGHSEMKCKGTVGIGGVCCTLGQSQGFSVMEGDLIVCSLPAAAVLVKVSSGPFRLDRNEQVPFWGSLRAVSASSSPWQLMVEGPRVPGPSLSSFSPTECRQFPCDRSQGLWVHVLVCMISILLWSQCAVYTLCFACIHL